MNVIERSEADLVVAVRGPATADEILAAAAGTLAAAARAAGHPAAHPWHALAVPLGDPAHSWEARFALLRVHVLPHWPVHLVFEATGADLTDQAAFRDPEVAALIAAWAAEPGPRGRVLITGAVPAAP